MDSLKITVENYRNIPLNYPITFDVKEGVCFILGINNIGKSTILRFFFEMRTALKDIANNLGTSYLNSYLYGNVFFDEAVNRNNLNSAIKFTIEANSYKLNVVIKPSDPGNFHTNKISISQTLNPNSGVADQSKINSLRKNIAIIADNFYIGSFRAVDVNATGESYDIKIGQDFVKIWSEWSVGRNIVHSRKINEFEEELCELLGFKKFSIKIGNEKDTLKITTDEGSFMLNELGSGIAQFIIVLGNALIRNPAFILIDEPEIGLHPKLQEVFIRALASKARHGLVASSHSIGLARSTYDTQILSLTRDSSGKLNLRPFGLNYEPSIFQSINELGYSQFIEIGGNNILLVEGRTDIKSYREVLRIFGIESKFIIMSFGGSEFVIKDKTKIYDELSELKRLNANSYSVIFDSDRKSFEEQLSEKHLAFKEVCESLGFNTHSTVWRSTENYISQKAIDAILGPGKSIALTPFEDFNKKSDSWDKNKNWLMFKEMKKEDFEKSLVEYFEKLKSLAYNK